MISRVVCLPFVCCFLVLRGAFVLHVSLFDLLIEWSMPRLHKKRVGGRTVSQLSSLYMPS